MAPRVLVIDDEESLREALSIAFDGAGFKVETAESAEEGLLKARAASFDAMLVDKNLPRMSGLDFVAEVRRFNLDAAVAVITGFSSEESARAALNLDVDGYVEKPFDDLLSIVERTREMIDKRKRRRPWTGGTPRASLKIVASGPPELDRQLAPIRAHGTIELVAREQLLPALKAAPADVVILDSRLYGADLVAEVDRAVCQDPLATFVVLYTGDVGLPALQRLIELGVKGLFDLRGSSRDLDELLLRVKARPRRAV